MANGRRWAVWEWAGPLMLEMANRWRGEQEDPLTLPDVLPADLRRQLSE